MNKNLHVYSKMDEIISAVENYDTVILTAETGSGKSTQVPQMLFENGYDVIVTQPRRIACISLADRVAEEMEDLSYVVGYHTAFESSMTDDTRILFCTDGLQMAKGIRNIDNTILVLDEVHEWNLNIETLVAWIKKFRADGNRLKVILMSATIELEDLADFYGEAKCISISGRNYDVEKLHKNSIEMIRTIASYNEQKRNILVFVEGKKEIDDLIKKLTDDYEVDAEIFPLHGDLPASEQRLCFKQYDRPKIIVSTNIAQTSVTIPDIDVVIDNGKEKRIEVNDGIEGLFVHDISKADCLQRAGRAGRTKDGVYVLCSAVDLDGREEYSTPEIQRLVLDKVVLKLMSVGINPLELEFFHQPSIESLTDSIDTLKMLGAIMNDRVTTLGLRMIKIPVSVRYARMIIEAERYGCTETLIKAVSIMETGSLIDYKAKKQDMFGDDLVKMSYSDFVKENRSDILAEIEIYNNIINYKYENLAKAGINKKVFHRVREFITKLEDSIYSEVELSDETPSKLDFIKCIYAGIPDRLFENEYYANNYSDIDGNFYKLKEGSCCTYGYNFVLAIPKTITFKSRCGGDDTLNILTMATGIKKEEFNEIAPDALTITPDESSTSYDASNNCFILKFRSSIAGFYLEDWYETIRSDDPRFAQLQSTHANLIELENSKRVVIGRNVYEMQTDFWDKSPYISINRDDDILMSDIKTLKDANGKPVKFKNGFRENFNLDILRQAILKDREKQQIEEVLSRLPKGKTGSIKVIIDEFLSQIGKVDCSIPKLNIELFKYVGLELDKESAAFKVFDDETEAEESTNDTLKFMIKKTITQNYGDKKFIIKRDGKKIETKKTEAAKQEFHEYCQEIIADTTAENFAEQLQFLDEIFNECVESFQ